MNIKNNTKLVSLVDRDNYIYKIYKRTATKAKSQQCLVYHLTSISLFCQISTVCKYVRVSKK